MTPAAQAPQRRAQRLISRGFAPPPQPAAPATLVEVTGSVPENSIPENSIIVLCHTYVSRCEAREHLDHVAHLADRLERARQAHPRLPFVLCVGMQWRPGQQQEASDRLAAIGRAVAKDSPGLPYAGLSVPGAEKVLTTNAAVRALGSFGPRGWLWLDDDIWLEPDCLSELVTRFNVRVGPMAVGATKLVDAAPYRTAQLLRWLSRATTPRRNYPNACCMLVSADVIADGIPDRLGADDAFVLFELLDPTAADPFHALVLAPGARCRVVRGGRAGDVVNRLRASMFSHIMHMADYPWPKARVYFTETLFFGLWPFTPLDTRRGLPAAAARWLVKAVYFAWFSVEAAVLLARGLLNHPRRQAPWATTAEYLSPQREAIT